MALYFLKADELKQHLNKSWILFKHFLTLSRITKRLENMYCVF